MTCKFLSHNAQGAYCTAGNQLPGGGCPTSCSAYDLGYAIHDSGNRTEFNTGAETSAFNRARERQKRFNPHRPRGR
jgi:hypothetical protein